MSRIDLTDDIQALLRHDLRAEHFVAFGRGIGDSIEDLPMEWIVRGEPLISASFQILGEKILICRAGEADFSPYDLAEQYQDVRQHGGCLRLRTTRPAGNVEVLFTTREGRITQVMLVGSWLAGVGGSSESELLKNFGATEHRARRYGWSKFYWPARGIALNCREGALFSVAIGGVDPREFTFSAVDLIRLALEWDAAHPGRAWPLGLAEGPTRVAAARLEALLQAFGVASVTKRLLRAKTWTPPNPLDAFLSGQFLEGMTAERRERISAYLTDPSSGLPHSLERDGSSESPQEVMHFWKRMIQFRNATRQVTDFNSGVLESGWGYFLLSVRWSAAIGRSLQTDIEILDRALAFMVDPDQRALPWGRLISEFDFPDEDYEELVSDEY